MMLCCRLVGSQHTCRKKKLQHTATTNRGLFLKLKKKKTTGNPDRASNGLLLGYKRARQTRRGQKETEKAHEKRAWQLVAWAATSDSE